MREIEINVRRKIVNSFKILIRLENFKLNNTFIFELYRYDYVEDDDDDDYDHDDDDDNFFLK